MSRFLAAFRTLRWRLTFHYTLVTVSALLALEALVLGIGLATSIVFGGRAPALMARGLATDLAPQLRPYFAGPEPDLGGIHEWLGRVRREGVRAGGEDWAIAMTPQDLARPETHLLVLDLRGRVLGSDDQDVPPASPTMLDPAAAPGLDQVFPVAVSGEVDPARLHTRPSIHHLTMAVPIRGDDGRVAGALVFSTPFPWLTGAGVDFLVPLGVSAIVFTVGAGLIGTIFGYFTAKGMTRRLDRIAKATTAWGSADFSPTIGDRSSDEIGRLGRSLDRMSRQLEDLIRTRQRLSTVEERNRLGRELHDSVKQQVFAISMNLGAARSLWDRDPAEARRSLDAAFDLARQSQQELSAIIQALRPVELEGKHVQAAIRELVERWGRETHIAVTCEADGEATLSPQAEEALYRIVQEALTNVARHSRASAARVTLTARGSGVTLEIEDNGAGFDPAQDTRGMGLRTMRERAESVGGRLEVTSQPTGTTVHVAVPPAEERREDA